MRIFCYLTIAFSLLFPTSYAHATLYDRGGGLIYDSTLDITWLQDANYAWTSGYDADGLMDWATAKTWASNLYYYDSVRSVAYADWRLPKVAPLGDYFDYGHVRDDGTSDRGYNIVSKNSELSNLWNGSLGNLGYCKPHTSNASYGCEEQPGWGLENSGPFKNMESWWYWTGTEYPGTILAAWGFNTWSGLQDGHQLYAWYELNAWAVRDGDVASADNPAIPEPASLALFGVALLGSLLPGKRQRSKPASIRWSIRMAS